MTTSDEQIKMALDDLGLSDSDDMVAQLREFVGALKIYQRREKVHQGNWKRFGWKDSIHHMKSKFSRLNQHRLMASVHGEEAFTGDLDDAYDLMNYTVFFVRNVVGGNYGEVAFHEGTD